MKKIICYILFFILLVVFIFIFRHKMGAFLCNQGNKYLQLKDYRKAVASYCNSIRVNPGVWMTHLGLAEAYRENKDYRKAEQEYMKVLALNPSNSRSYDSLASIYFQNGDYEKAMEILLDGQKNNPSDKLIKESYKNYCLLYLSDALSKSTEMFISHKEKEAIAMLGNALSRCPGDAFAYYTLGYFYYAGRDYEPAEMNLHKSIAQNTKFSHAYKLLSDISLEKKDIEKAVFFAQEAVTLETADAPSYHHLGLLLMHLERYAEALPYLKKAVSLEPSNADYLYSLGSVYRDNKMYKEAIAEYNKLSVFKNDYPNLHNDLADIYVLLGQVDESVAKYQQGIRYCQEKLKNSPHDPVTLNNYAHALNGVGQSDKALEIVKVLVVQYPQYRQPHLTMSWIYEKLNKYDLALKSLEAAKQLSSGKGFIDDGISRLKRDSLFKENIYEGNDRVYLKNGRMFSGRIKKEQLDKVVLEVQLGPSSGELVFYRDAIARIDKMKINE